MPGYNNTVGQAPYGGGLGSGNGSRGIESKGGGLPGINKYSLGSYGGGVGGGLG